MNMSSNFACNNHNDEKRRFSLTEPFFKNIVLALKCKKTKGIVTVFN